MAAAAILNFTGDNNAYHKWYRMMTYFIVPNLVEIFIPFPGITSCLHIYDMLHNGFFGLLGVGNNGDCLWRPLLGHQISYVL